MSRFVAGGRAAVLVLVSAGAAAMAGEEPNLVVNGSFEVPAIAVPNTTVAAGSTALTGWTISGTSGIDLVRGLWQPAEGMQSISLNWVTPSTIAQAITTEVDALYEISFAMAAESPQAVATVRTVDVVWSGTSVATVSFDPAGHTNADMGWASHAFAVTGGGTDELKFRSITAHNFNYGPALDAVSVRMVLGIGEQPDSVVACAGAAGTFAVTARGDGPFEYAWQVRVAETWVALEGGPVTLDCGGQASAGTPTAATTTIAVTGCAGDFEVRCVAVNSFGSVASDTATLTVCAADFDCDGFVSGVDFDLYVQAFEAGELSADFDGDGFVTGIDFDLYVLAFEAGC